MDLLKKQKNSEFTFNILDRNCDFPLSGDLVRKHASNSHKHNESQQIHSEYQNCCRPFGGVISNVGYGVVQSVVEGGEGGCYNPTQINVENTESKRTVPQPLFASAPLQDSCAASTSK